MHRNTSTVVASADPTQRWWLPFCLMGLCGFTFNNVLAWVTVTKTGLDPATFTLIRLWSGIGGALIARAAFKRKENRPKIGRLALLAGGAALFVYAAPFAYAYKVVGGGVGATILFVVAQFVLIGAGIGFNKEQPSAMQWLAIVIALFGFVCMIGSALLSNVKPFYATMLCAGIAWGSYVAIARWKRDAPLALNLGSFIIAAVISIPCWLIVWACNPFGIPVSWDVSGAAYAAISGVVCSGFAYSMWFLFVKEVPYIMSGVVQLATPVFVTACLFAGFGASPTFGQVTSAIGALVGMALYLFMKPRAKL